MKRKLTSAISIGLLVLSMVAILPRSTHGQTNTRRQHRVSSGIITLNQGEFLRLTLSNANTNPDAPDSLTARVRAVVVDFAPSVQQGQLTRLEAVGQRSSGPITLRPGEGASMDIDLSQASRSDVQSFFIIVEALPFANSNNHAAACVATLTKFDGLGKPLSVWVWAEADGGYVWM